MRNLVVTALLTMMGGALLTGPAAAQKVVNLNVISPGVAYNAGLVDLAKSYTEKTGIVVTVEPVGMTKVVEEGLKGTYTTDVMIVPVAFADGLEAEGAIAPGSRAELGKVYVGLAVRKGQPRPDISTPEKLAAVLKAGGTVLGSNPAGGSMEGNIINNLLRQNAIFKGVHYKVVTGSEGGQALVKGDGDMALQLVCEIVNHPEIELVGIVPDQLHAYIDTAIVIPKRSKQQAAAKAFIDYLLAPDNAGVWKAKGLEREN